MILLISQYGLLITNSHSHASLPPKRFGKSTRTKKMILAYPSKLVSFQVHKMLTLASAATLAHTAHTRSSISSSIKSSNPTINMAQTQSTHQTWTLQSYPALLFQKTNRLWSFLLVFELDVISKDTLLLQELQMHRESKLWTKLLKLARLSKAI